MSPDRACNGSGSGAAVRWTGRWLVFGGLAVAGCALDLGTKTWIFRKLGNFQSDAGELQAPICLWDGVFYLETHLNEGALFGIGQGQVSLFAMLSLIAVAGVLGWLAWGAAIRDRWLTVALGLITGGILGNLYDRLGLPGLHWAPGIPPHAPGDPVYAVRDWLHFKIEAIGFDWPVFNIADSLLVCGAGLLICHAFLHRSDAAESADSAAAGRS